MNPNIKAYKRSQYVISAVIIVLGLILCTFSWLLIDMIGLVFALTFVIFGVTLGVKCILATKYESFSGLKLVLAIIIVILGMACFSNPASIIHFITSIVGVCILTAAINNIFKFVKFNVNKKYLSFEFIKYCLNFLFGFLLLFSPGFSSNMLLIIFGAYLIYFGITFAIDTKNAEIHLS